MTGASETKPESAEEGRIIPYDPAGPEDVLFLDAPGEAQLYIVHHHAARVRRGGVVMAMPFAHERVGSYSSCVRWARELARAGFDVVRFDYRGVGESSGRFGELDLHERREDVRLAASYLKDRLGGAPLILHGMRLGAVLVSELFAEGLGDAMLLWAAPTSARDHFLEVMRFMLAIAMVHGPTESTMTREQMIARLEAGERHNVGGYFWNKRLWDSSAARALRLPADAEHRPWRALDVLSRGRTVRDMGPHRAGVHGARFWEESSRFFPEIDGLMESSLRWLEHVGTRGSGVRA